MILRGPLACASLYISAPLLLAVITTLLTFRAAGGHYFGLFLLTLFALLPIALDLFLVHRGVKEQKSISRLNFDGFYARIAIFFGFAISLVCISELIVYGAPISNPSTYADFSNGRLHFRHISNMAWALIPIGLLLVPRRPFIRTGFVTLGLSFPVLVVDRNRLLAAVFCLFVIQVLQRRNLKYVFGGIFAAVLGLFLFSMLGIARSGSVGQVDLPFSSVFLQAPSAVQWLLLYISCGVYNFSSVLDSGFRDAGYFLNQVVPFFGAMVNDIPFEAANINVGTEYFPLLLAYGPFGVLLGLSALYLMLFLSIRALRLFPNLFTVLLFLRLAYVAIMSPFAPQVFTWTNFGFIFLCLGMWLAAALFTRFARISVNQVKHEAAN